MRLPYEKIAEIIFKNATQMMRVTDYPAGGELFLIMRSGRLGSFFSQALILQVPLDGISSGGNAH